MESTQNTRVSFDTSKSQPNTLRNFTGHSKRLRFDYRFLLKFGLVSVKVNISNFVLKWF